VPGSQNSARLVLGTRKSPPGLRRRKLYAISNLVGKALELNANGWTVRECGPGWAQRRRSSQRWRTPRWGRQALPHIRARECAVDPQFHTGYVAERHLESVSWTGVLPAGFSYRTV